MPVMSPGKRDVQVDKVIPTADTGYILTDIISILEFGTCSLK
jgi:hypothetical protein